MKAIVCHKIGTLEDLVLEDVQLPPVAPGEVRVALHAASVNFPDLLMIQGKYQFKPPLPFSPGLESAGEVVEVGAGAQDVARGDRVITQHRYGGFAEEIIVPAITLHPLPENFSFAEGAAFMAGYNTAYVALYHRGKLQKGETLLVHGASGGMGLAAVEIGKLLGARVIGVASNDEKLKIVHQKHADHLIHPAGGFREQVLELTGGHGADVIYDPVGGDVFDESTRCIAWGGRLLVIGFAGGRIAEIKTNIPLIKGFSVVGVRAGEYGRRNPQGAIENMKLLFKWAGQGKLRPYISRIYPLEQAKEALQLLANRQAMGKVVLAIRESPPVH